MCLATSSPVHSPAPDTFLSSPHLLVMFSRAAAAIMFLVAVGSRSVLQVLDDQTKHFLSLKIIICNSASFVTFVSKIMPTATKVQLSFHFFSSNLKVSHLKLKFSKCKVNYWGARSTQPCGVNFSNKKEAMEHSEHNQDCMSKLI